MIFFTNGLRAGRAKSPPARAIPRSARRTRAVISTDPDKPGPAHAGATGVDAERREVGGAEAALNSDLEPLSMSLLGRLFGVPLLIISFIVAIAIFIVLFFGSPSARPARSLDEILATLESNSGAKSMGLLLPQEKALWQTALDLSQRLENKDEELTAEEVDEVAARVSQMILADLEHFESMPSFGKERATQIELRTRRLEFLIHALGRTERPEALPTLIEIVEGRQEPYARIAMQQLGNLHDLPGAKRGVQPVLGVVKSSREPETLLVGATVLSVLADPGNDEVIETLAALRLGDEGEVAWSAALALARLGSDRGKSTLLDLLSREFWSSGERYRMVDASGTVRRFPMPPQMIDQWLIAAIDATRHLNDSDLWELVEKLESDPSLEVRARASEVLAERAESAG